MDVATLLDVQVLPTQGHTPMTSSKGEKEEEAASARRKEEMKLFKHSCCLACVFAQMLQQFWIEI